MDLALAHGFLGAAASRFLALATLLGLGGLAAAAGLPSSGDAVLAMALRPLWPLALLTAMELWSRAAAPAAAAPAAPALAPSAELPEPEADGPATRHGLQEILHDLRSPLTVIRLYAELLIASRTRTSCASSSSPRAPSCRSWPMRSRCSAPSAAAAASTPRLTPTAPSRS